MEEVGSVLTTRGCDQARPHFCSSVLVAEVWGSHDSLASLASPL